MHCGAFWPGVEVGLIHLHQTQEDTKGQSSLGADDYVGPDVLLQVTKTGDPDAYFGEMGWLSNTDLGVTEVPSAKFWTFVGPRP